MSGRVVVTLRRSAPAAPPKLRYAAIVRVRAAGRATSEQWLPYDTPLELAVEPGEVSVDVTFSSGQMETQQVRVAEGQSVPVEFTVSPSSDEKLDWIDLSQDKRQVRRQGVPTTADKAARRASPFAHRKDFPEQAFDEIATEAAEIVLLQGEVSERARIVADEPVGKVRRLEIDDPRFPDELRRGTGNGVAFLALRDPGLGLTKVCALPGPFRERHCRVQVALTRSDSEALWQVDVVPTHPELAPIVGFLKQNDQRALSLLREHVPRAVGLMSEKIDDPIPAAIGLAFLLRAGELDRIKGWSRQLWRLFPALPDAAALHAGVMLREPEATREWEDEFAAAVLGAASSGVPFLTDALRRLNDAIWILQEMRPTDARVAKVKQWMRTVLRSSDPEAVFTSLTLRSSQESAVFGVSTTFGGVAPSRATATEPNQRRGPVSDETNEATEQHRVRTAFAPIVAVLRERRSELRQVPGLAVARPGYTIQGDSAVPALVLALKPGSPSVAAGELGARFGVPVRSSVASPSEQILGASEPSFDSALLRWLEPEAVPFAAPRRGTYEPPSGPDAPRLEPIEEEMEVTVCASPDAGWPVLRDFFGEEIKKRLVVAMYDFTAKHVEKALTEALEGTDATFLLVLDAKPASGGVGGNGINGEDREEAQVMKRLRQSLEDRFQLVAASVGAGGAVPKAYHIKVAVADTRRVWLSSGNWQSSNQALFDFENPDVQPPFPLSRYNRDYHVIVRNKALAACYEKFIEYDATLGGDFAGPVLESLPWLLVREEELAEDFAPIKRFRPQTFQGNIKVTPLLTPDNFPDVVNRLLRSAKKRVWLQNQYIQPNEDGENFPEFERLLSTLGKLAKKKNFDLRLCLRAVDEPYRDRLFAAGVRPASVRRQGNCHAKLIVIDDDVVVVGSQNLSNVGFVANRDASLVFEHEGIARYFADVFETDWERATRIADDDSFSVRVTEEGGEVPAGFVKVPWSALYDSNPPATNAGGAPVAVGGAPVVIAPVAEAPIAVAPEGPLDLPFFGVDPESGKRRVESSQAVAGVLKGAAPVEADKARLGRMMQTPAFGFGPALEDDEDFAETGWGVIWGASVTPEIKAALKPLLDHRREACGPDGLFQEFDYRAGESVRAFLQRNGTDHGGVTFEKVPFYLLLVGGPKDIPFSFQTLLDVEYRVGRLDLPTPEAYRKYATSLVATELGTDGARERVVHAFGAEHEGDTPTQLSAEVLVRATPRWIDRDKNRKLKEKFGLSAKIDVGEAASKARLLEILRGASGRPELLFTAGHGLACAAGSPRQPGEQGALVTADWDGFSRIDAASRFAAEDLPADADVAGMVVFLFACYGVGTPATDSFPTRAGQALAPHAFCSALPQALLSHQRGASLGVFGHVDRTLTWSLQPPQAPVATAPFERAMLYVLRGAPLGRALDDLNQRGATLAATVAEALRPAGSPLDDVKIVSDWTQQRDATAFILLGDPGARLKR